MSMTQELDLSVIIPVFNEEENLTALLSELNGVLRGIGQTFEMICIDDASTDNSRSVLDRRGATHPELRVAAFRKNCGQSAGQATGFQLARGRVIITMDGDLQNDPADISAFLNHLTGDVACVCGIRRKRQDSLIKKISSRIGNRFRDIITGDRIQDAGCTFRAIRRRALREVLVFNGMHRFMPTILRAQGYRVLEIPVNHRPRFKGVSKYGIGNRMWRGIYDCFAIRWYIKRALTAERLREAGPGGERK
jgi:dolichol-phosphate mannosyltransferase